MKFVQIIKDSFIEYEEEHSLVLFSYGCNFKCNFCYNYDFVTNKHNIIRKPFKSILKHNITPLHTAIVFAGGEPTIWSDDLIKNINYIKDHYPNLKIKIFTNGYDRLTIFGLCHLVDCFSIDIKCVNNCEKITGIKNYLNTIARTINLVNIFSNITLELRTTEFEGLDINAVKTWVKTNYPGVKHIVSKDFRKNIK